VSAPLVQIDGPLRDRETAQPGRAAPRRLPEWARKSRTHFESLNRLKSDLRRLNLHTVCESARCPNIHECFHRGAATFMILGNYCTRGCGFCSVPKANPRKHDMRLDPAEPANVARMAAGLNLRYVVITSVNRDDLEDGGSKHFAQTVREVRRALPEARVEVLTPDFCGNLDAVARVLDAGPHVFNHNMETVPRLYRRVRPQAKYQQSLDVLAFARRHSPQTLTKSGFMAGLGETEDEVHALLRDLRAHQVDVATIGQYLQPTRRNLPVVEYIEPRRFDAYRDYGLSLGFQMVFSGPLVRSSYMADAVADAAARSAPPGTAC
jgi:lipoyl synthase